LILSTAKDAEARRFCDLVGAMLVDRLIAPPLQAWLRAGGRRRDGNDKPGRGLGLGKVW
jgi:hypothetical protein